MFSALKFIAAAAIVALFGGFLLAGILTSPQGDEMAPAAVTESPSPTTTEELLSGMVTEEVEPGVYRVVNDGVRDLMSVEAVDIVAGYDGGTWLLWEDKFIRLGGDETHGWPTDTAPEDHIFEVAPDGTIWVIPRRFAGDEYVGYDPDMRQGAGLRSTDGEEWTTQPCPSEDCVGFTVAPDGTVWASWRVGSNWRVGHLGPTGWQPLDGYVRSDTPLRGYRRLFFTDAGDLFGHERGLDGFFRYEDSDWQLFFHAGYGNVDVGCDGTVWLSNDDGLNRFADGAWIQLTSDDLVDDVRFRLGNDYQFEVAPDGSLWTSLWWSPSVCDGLARIDGETLDSFLPGQCITMDTAADGSVWVLAEENKGKDLYVITPKAVAASE